MVSFGNPRRRVPPLPYYRATNRSEGMEKFDPRVESNNRGGEVEKRISFPSIPRVYLTRIIPRFPPLIFSPPFVPPRSCIKRFYLGMNIYRGFRGIVREMRGSRTVCSWNSIVEDSLR